MTYSIDIPMFKEPSFEELQTCINEEFKFFNLPNPTYAIEKEFVLIQSPINEFCWFDMQYFEPSIREIPECEYMGSVSTRGYWWYAGVVVYAICKNYGKIIFNDSGATLGEPGTYTLSEFKKLLDDLHPIKS